MNDHFKPALAELIGTFLLVFIGAGSGATNAGLVGVALAHGIALMVIIYAFGSISGAHVNPAVTIGLALTGKVATQLAANVSPIAGVAVEAILTFFLVTAVFASGVANKNGNMAGVAIGLVLTMDILMGGTLTGASMNPARTFGPAITLFDFNNFWVYLVGPILGGAVAAVIYDRAFMKS
ncbi:MAG: aquaporin [Chloroflexi bacterium]|nr:aquaporin [Chloroflexota bacterium]